MEVRIKRGAEYVGKAGKYFVKVRRKMAHFLLSRYYKSPSTSDRIKVGWNFNMGGRINYIDIRFYSSPEIVRLLEVGNYKGRDEMWREADIFKMGCIPENAEFYPGFSKLDEFEKYQRLIYFGHGTCEAIIKAVFEQDFEEIVVSQGRQRPLRDIVDDRQVIDALSKSANFTKKFSLIFDRSDKDKRRM